MVWIASRCRQHDYSINHQQPTSPDPDGYSFGATKPPLAQERLQTFYTRPRSCDLLSAADRGSPITLLVPRVRLWYHRSISDMTEFPTALGSSEGWQFDTRPRESSCSWAEGCYLWLGACFTTVREQSNWRAPVDGRARGGSNVGKLRPCGS